MSRGVRAYAFSSIPAWSARLDGFGGDKAAVVCAVVGAAAAAVFVCAHWSVALVGAIIVVTLSAMENEPLLLLVIFLLPLRLLLQWNVPVREVFLALRALVIIGFFLGRLLRGQLGLRGLLRPTLTRASLLFLCAATASALLGNGGLTEESARALWILFTCVGFYFVILSWADSPRRIGRILHVLLFSTIITAGFGLFQEVIGDYTSFWLFLNPPGDFFEPMGYRTPSFFASPNYFSSYLNLVLPFSLACWVLGEGRWKRLGAWTTGLGAVALLCTQSLGGIIGFGGIAVLAILCFSRNWKKQLSLLGGFCALGIMFYFARSILNPAHQGADFGYDAATRLVLWGIAWNFFTHSPVFGVGWGNFEALYGSYVAGIPWIPVGLFSAHNIFLQLLSETGLIGFGAFFLLIFRAVRQALRQLRGSADTMERALAFGVLGAILGMLLHGLVDYFLASPQFGTLFWVLLALLASSKATCKARSSRQEGVEVGRLLPAQGQNA